ncbi:hypothetical protein Microterr_25070 [Microbacterium terricola]|uniref:MarR family transcriptional regulator n=1 Tax=Microbacterium terricola TaxID=344163 RepID=A0ABM8E1L5_9MICO|nr:hypothetical protein Microterr_25070 [Microbacterium terricola]
MLAEARVAVGRAERELHSGLSESERATLAALLRRTAFPA